MLMVYGMEAWVIANVVALLAASWGRWGPSWAHARWAGHLSGLFWLPAASVALCALLWPLAVVASIFHLY
ncbi:MAG: hypothetical protein JWM31_2686 [Solirubrobacterales bacterium]|nr:hypothetical protein [Solirubrobacterales bacterium]